MDLTGQWYNELGSTMNLTVSGNMISGEYFSAVGEAQGPYPLVGYFDASDENPTLGFTVAWQNDQEVAHSVTTWCGQAMTIGGNEYITAMWLLATSAAQADQWQSTMVGQDSFSRTQPSKEAIQKARLLRGLK